MITRGGKVAVVALALFALGDMRLARMAAVRNKTASPINTIA
jgi:hypothetical protein